MRVLRIKSVEEIYDQLNVTALIYSKVVESISRATFWFSSGEE